MVSISKSSKLSLLTPKSCCDRSHKSFGVSVLCHGSTFPARGSQGHHGCIAGKPITKVMFGRRRHALSGANVNCESGGAESLFHGHQTTKRG